MMQFARLLLLVALALVVMWAGVYVWPTKYHYAHIGLGSESHPVRINRMTGEAEILFRDGWKRAEPNP